MTNRAKTLVAAFCDFRGSWALSTALHYVNQLRLAIAVGNVTEIMELDCDRSEEDEQKEGCYAWIDNVMFCPTWTYASDDDDMAVTLGLKDKQAPPVHYRFSDESILGIAVPDRLLMSHPDELAELIQAMEETNHAEEQ